MKNWICLPLVLCLFVSTCLAAEPVSQESPAKETLVSLSAQAMAEVPNDEVVVHFRVEAQGQRLEPLRLEVNRISSTIMKSLKHKKDLEVKTTNRRVDPVWEKGSYQRKRTGWFVMQSGSITSTKLDDVPTWLDMIEQAGAKLQSLSFQVSDKLRQTKQDELRMQAIGLFRQKAVTVASSLEAKSYQIVRLQTDGSEPVYATHREMAFQSKMSVASAEAPALASGKSRIAVSVRGEIALKKHVFSVP